MTDVLRRRGPCALLCLLLAAVWLAGCGGAASSLPQSNGAPPPLSSKSEAAPSSSAPAPPPKPRRSIDFEALKSDNPDTLAWLEVPGTSVNYAVMRGIDNAYYLTHNESKAYSSFGAVFADMSSPESFNYPLTVLYGHYTPDETHFTQLHRYEDPDFFKENKDVYFWVPGVQRRYEIVFAGQVGDENPLYAKDYYEEETMRGFLDSLKEPGDEKANVDLTGAGVKDRYLLLCTCTQAEEWTDQRYIVVAKLAEAIAAE